MTNGNIIKFRGVLTSYEYAAPPQDKSGKKKHRIGIKVNADDMATLKAEIKDAGVYAKSPVPTTSVPFTGMQTIETSSLHSRTCTPTSVSLPVPTL